MESVLLGACLHLLHAPSTVSYMAQAASGLNVLVIIIAMLASENLFTCPLQFSL